MVIPGIGLAISFEINFVLGDCFPPGAYIPLFLFIPFCKSLGTCDAWSPVLGWESKEVSSGYLQMNSNVQTQGTCQFYVNFSMHVTQDIFEKWFSLGKEFARKSEILQRSKSSLQHLFFLLQTGGL